MKAWQILFGSLLIGSILAAELQNAASERPLSLDRPQLQIQDGAQPNQAYSVGTLSSASRSLPALAQLGSSNNATVDWRTSGKLTPVKYQGLCGSCWAFASTALYQAFLAQTTGQLVELSEEYLLQCTPKSDCGGGLYTEALKLIQSKGGMPKYAEFPYVAENTQSGHPTTTGICETGNLVKHSKNFTIYRSNMVELQDLKGFLNIGPVAIKIFADQSFSQYTGGQFSCKQRTLIVDLNHGVLLVGYDNDNNWIVRNSYGPNWGESGYFRLTTDINKNCGANYDTYRLFGQRAASLVWLPILLLLAALTI